MTTLYQDIRGALQAQAATASGFPGTAQRQYEGVLFTPTTGTPWARMTLIPVQARPMVVSSARKQHRGIFQVDVMIPAGEGTADAETAADAVKDVFDPAIKIAAGTDVLTLDYAERAQAMIDPNWIFCPVSIGWRLFSTRN